MKQVILTRFSVILYFLILSFSNVFASQFDIERQEDKELTLSIKKECLKIKQINFENFKNPSPRFAYLYLNSLLDYILDHNKTILEEKGLKDQKFCIYLSDDSKDVTEDKGEGLILFKVKDLILPFFESSDLDVASSISHELAHDILNHREKISDTLAKLYEVFMKDSSIKDKTPSKFDAFYKKHPIYLEQARKYEIEADELGFKLYLNSGFIPSKYGMFLLKLVNISAYYHLFNMKSSRNNVFSSLSDEEFSLFKSTSEPQTCITLGKKALQQNQLDSFMNSIKYIPNFEDPHPTCCWRFWNIIKKILLYPEIANPENNTISDAIFLKIDLNKYEHLKDLKNAASQQKFEEVNAHFTQAINDMITNENSSKIKFTIDTKSKRATFYEKDNFLIIKLYSFLLRPLLESTQN